MRVLTEVLTGDPVYAELARQPGAQVRVGDSLRAQWVGVVEGEVSTDSSYSEFEAVDPEWERDLPEADHLSHDPFADLGASLSRPDPGKKLAWVKLDSAENQDRRELLRVSSAKFLEEHGGWLGPGGAEWSWLVENRRNVDLVSMPAYPESVDSIRLFVVPKITEMEFEVAGLPDLPNGRDIEDLFDARIPRLTLSGSPGKAEDQLVGLLCAAAQMTWEKDDLWSTHSGPFSGGSRSLKGFPAALPPDRTFRNTTPQELLHWYVGHTPGASVEFDEPEMTLYFNQDQTGFLQWWNEFRRQWWPF